MQEHGFAEAFTPSPSSSSSSSSSCAVVTSGQMALEAIAARGYHGKTCMLFGWDRPAPELDALRLTYTRDAASADFLLAKGGSGVTTASGSVLVPSDFATTGDLSQLEPVLAAAVEQGVLMVVANNDVISRTPDGGVGYRPGLLADRYEALGGDTLRFGKPGAASFKRCLEALREAGVDDIGRVCHVGDSLHHDVAGANGAGIDSVFIVGGVHAEELGVEAPGGETGGEQKGGTGVGGAGREGKESSGGDLLEQGDGLEGGLEDRLEALFAKHGHRPTHSAALFSW